MAKKAFVYDGSQWVDIAQSTADLSNYANMTTTPISGFRNAIINGDFRINQRGFTSTTTNLTYGFDRWILETNTGTCTYSTQAFTPGNAISGYEPTNYARLVTSGQTATTGYSVLEQRIEDVRTFAGQTITISFWAKAASGTPKVSIELAQKFGTGGSPSTTVNTYAGQVTLSTSWSRYSVAFTVPSISGKTIGTTASTSSLDILLWVSAGSDYSARTNSLGIQSNTFDFWGVQVEKGTIATPFEQRPVSTELALCQRYYYKWENSSASLGMTISTTWYGSPQTFPVPLRTSTPTITTVSPGVLYGAGTSVNVSSFSAGVTTSGNLNVWQFTASLSSGPASYTWTWCTFNTHSATFNAEL